MEDQGNETWPHEHTLPGIWVVEKRYFPDMADNFMEGPYRGPQQEDGDEGLTDLYTVPIFAQWHVDGSVTLKTGQVPHLSHDRSSLMDHDAPTVKVSVTELQPDYAEYRRGDQKREPPTAGGLGLSL